VDWNREALNYFEQIRAQGFKTGLYVANSKLMTQEHVTRMNTVQGRIEFVSRCPANFAEKLESKTIAAAYEKNSWVDLGSFSETKGTCTYRGSTTIELYGAPLRLVVLESNSLGAGVTKSCEKQKKALDPLIKKLIQPRYSRLADAKTTCTRFCAQKQTRLFLFDLEIVKHAKKIWPKGHRGADTKPKIKTPIRLWLKTRCATKRPIVCLQGSSLVLCLLAMRLSGWIGSWFWRIRGRWWWSSLFVCSSRRRWLQLFILNLRGGLGFWQCCWCLRCWCVRLSSFGYVRGCVFFGSKIPEGSLRAGLGGRELSAPTFKLLFEHAFNCWFVRERGLSYSFCWPHGDAAVRVGVLLDLLGYSLEQLIT